MAKKSTRRHAANPRRVPSVVARTGRRELGRPHVVEALERRWLLSFDAAGPEMPVNVFTTNRQVFPSVAADGDGDFVVVWQSYGQDGNDFGIYARRFDAAGTPLQVPGAVAGTTEFFVNGTILGAQVSPSVAMDADGDFVVAWRDVANNGIGVGVGIYARRYDAAGVALGPAFVVNTTTTTAGQAAPTVATDALGDFVVAWQGAGQDGSGTGIYARRYDAAGIPQNGEFQVNTFTTGDQTAPTAAMDARGDFAIAWQSNGQDGPSSLGVYAKRYDAAGVPQQVAGAANGVTEFRVNTTTALNQFEPAAAMDAAGDLVVSWTDGDFTPYSYSPDYDVRAQRYDATGVPQGGALLVNVPSDTPHFSSAVAMDTDGDFLVTWEGYDQDGFGRGVFGRSFGAAGAPQGSEFEVNATVTGNQRLPSVAVVPGGDAVVAWESSGQDGSDYGVYAQRYDETTDTAGPFVSGVTIAGKAVVPGQRVTEAVTSVSIQFSKDLSVDGDAAGPNSALNPANYVLTRDGEDVSSLIASVAFGLNAATRKYEAVFSPSAPLLDGAYVLRVRDAVSDLAGNALDGDLDGAPGGESAFPFVVHSVARTGGEFRVNTYTPIDQAFPTIATARNGDFVVAWQSFGQDGGFYGVYAQRYSAAGVPRGSEFRVNTQTISSQQQPAVAMDAAGDFVIAWESYREVNDSHTDIYAKRYDPAGTELTPPPGVARGQGNEFLVSSQSASSDHKNSATVAMDARGDFVIGWASRNQDGGNFDYGVYAKRYDAAGHELVPPAGTQLTGIGNEFQVNTNTLGPQFNPKAAMDANGEFVIAWSGSSAFGPGLGEVFARRFDAGGAPQGGEFRVNSYDPGIQGSGSVSEDGVAVAMEGDGDFVVVWQSDAQDGSDTGIYGKRYSSAGAELPPPAGVPVGQGNEFRVNDTTLGTQEIPSVSADANGDFVVTWTSYLQHGDDQVFAKRYNSAGSELPSPAGATSTGGNVFRVNTTNPGNAGFEQVFSTVAMDAGGDFAAAWMNFNQDGSISGIYAQRYGPNQAPVAFGIADVTVEQEAPDTPDTVLSLTSAFGDANTPSGPLTFAVVGNTNPALFDGTPVSNAAGTLTLDYAPGQTGTSTLTVRATDSGGLSIDTSFTVIVTPNPDAPILLSIVVGDGSAQRSQVKGLTLTFDRPVVLGDGAMRLVQLNTGGSGANDDTDPTDASSALAPPTSPDGGFTWVYAFAADSPFVQKTNAGVATGSLVDGIYTATVDPAQVTANGVQMEGDATLTFHRLFGDQDGNKTVNNADYGRFRNAFLKSTGQAGFDAAFDFDGNGAVNNLDYGLFRARFLKVFSY